MRKIFSAALALCCVWFATPALAALPSGYTELEYIESTGTQYIDTGIQKGRFVHDIAFTVRDNKNLMGNSAGAGSYWGQNRGNAEDGFEFGSSKIFTSSLIRQTVVFNTIPTKTTLTANGETVASASSVASSTYYVFAINGATDLYRASAKLWSLKIYDGNDELIKNLVPAKNPDGKIGMYDTVSGEFFENKGEGTFVAGPVVEIKIATTKYNETAFSPLNTALANAISVVDSVVSNTITQAASIATLQAQKQTRPNDIADDNEKCPAGKKCLLVEDASGIPHWYEIVEPLLPAGYTQLQWIESTGTQWIDTETYGKTKTSVHIKYEPTGASSTQGFGIIGFQATFGGADTFARYTWTNQGNDQFRFGGISNESSIRMLPNIVREEIFGNNKWIIDGQTIDISTVNSNFSTSDTMTLFVIKSLDGEIGAKSLAKMKLYYCTIYDDGTMVRDFIPAKNSSGVVGMYDTVSGQFFTNAGTGEFIAGNPVVE